MPYVATSTDWFAGVSVFKPSAGQQTWIDDVSVIERLAPGDYELQVRADNGEGFGPWSATKTFTVHAPVRMRIGGEWVPCVRKVRIGGEWVMAYTRRIG